MVGSTLLWQFFSMFGDIQAWIGLTVGVLLIYQILPQTSKKRIAWIIFALLPAVIFSYQLTYVLKEWLHVPRPCADLSECPTSYSLPSGHAAVIFAFLAVSALNVKKKEVYIVAAALAVLVSLSRIFLNYHTPVDVIVGAAIGVFCGYLIHTAYKTFPMLMK